MGCIFRKMDTLIAHRLAPILDWMFIGIAGEAIGREPFFVGKVLADCIAPTGRCLHENCFGCGGFVD